ncbi:hypothetical protein ERJ75_001486300 [Trypanosoma vivax]|nr:hypothetical protein ERJ75_001487500 [Trypanosoma vivax]KAH8606719.1 hypothetical protein ERJ75_001486300 [Trypanosoma vivax]
MCAAITTNCEALRLALPRCAASLAAKPQGPACAFEPSSPLCLALRACLSADPFATRQIAQHIQAVQCAMVAAAPFDGSMCCLVACCGCGAPFSCKASKPSPFFAALVELERLMLAQSTLAFPEARCVSQRC